jgi:L-rhamnose isomerase
MFPFTDSTFYSDRIKNLDFLIVLSFCLPEKASVLLDISYHIGMQNKILLTCSVLIQNKRDIKKNKFIV